MSLNKYKEVFTDICYGEHIQSVTHRGCVHCIGTSLTNKEKKDLSKYKSILEEVNAYNSLDIVINRYNTILEFDFNHYENNYEMLNLLLWEKIYEY